MIEYLSSWRNYWDRFEAAAGLIAAFGLAYGPLTIASLTLVLALVMTEWAAAGCAAIVVAVTAPMAIWLTRMADSAMKRFRARLPGLPGTAEDDFTARQRRLPFAILLVAELPRLPLFARIPLAIWWLVHFAAAFAFIGFSDVMARQGNLWQGFAEGVTGVVFCYLFGFAANVFLMLAVTVGFESPMVTAAVWRGRFFIDAILTLPILLPILF